MTPPSPSDDASRASGGGNENDEAREDENEEGAAEGSSEGGTEVLLTLPDDLRGEFKEPFGPVFTDAGELLADVEGPVIAVGDVVTYHLVEAGRVPDIAVLDGYTERTPVDDEVGKGTGEYARRISVNNPAATLTVDLLDALAAALADIGSDDRTGQDPAAIDVDGEEDLCTLPAIVAAPSETSVVYGQPGEGMVHVPIATESRARARGLLERMDGDHETVWERLGVSAR